MEGERQVEPHASLLVFCVGDVLKQEITNHGGKPKAEYIGNTMGSYLGGNSDIIYLIGKQLCTNDNQEDDSRENIPTVNRLAPQTMGSKSYGKNQKHHR